MRRGAAAPGVAEEGSGRCGLDVLTVPARGGRLSRSHRARSGT